jgi:hypothetical protein
MTYVLRLLFVFMLTLPFSTMQGRASSGDESIHIDEEAVESGKSRPKIVIQGIEIPTNLFDKVLEFLDPRSLNSAQYVSHAWLEFIGTSECLIIPGDYEKQDKLFASCSFAQLFRRAMNTRGFHDGLETLIEYTGVFPSHFRSVYPFNPDAEQTSTDQEMLNAERKLYTFRIQKFMHQELGKERAKALRKKPRYPSARKLDRLYEREQESQFDRLKEIVPCLKLLAVIDRESFQHHVGALSACLGLFPTIFEKSAYKKFDATQVHLQCLILTEEPQHLQRFVSEFPVQNYDVDSYLPAFMFCFEHSPSMEVKQCDRLLRIVNLSRFPNAPVTQQLRTLIHTKLTSLKARTEDLSEKQTIAGLLADHFNEVDAFNVVVDAGARQGEYSIEAVEELYARRSPKAREGARQIVTQALEDKRAGKPVKCSERCLRLMLKSPDAQDVELTRSYTTACYRLDDPENAKLIDWTRLIPRTIELAILKSISPELARQVFDQSLAHDKAANSPQKLEFRTRQLATFFNDADAAEKLFRKHVHDPNDLPIGFRLLLALRWQNHKEHCYFAKGLLRRVDDAFKYNNYGPLFESEVAFVHAKYKNNDRAIELFKKALEQADDAEVIFTRACVLDDITFLAPIAGPKLDAVKQVPTRCFADNAKLFYFAKRVGLQDHAAFFLKDFLTQANRLASAEEKYELAKFLKAQPDQIEALNEEILEQLMAAKIARKLQRLASR